MKSFDEVGKVKMIQSSDAKDFEQKVEDIIRVIHAGQHTVVDIQYTTANLTSGNRTSVVYTAMILYY